MSMSAHINPTKGRAKTKADPNVPRVRDPEAILAFIAEQLVSRPPDPNGSHPVAAHHRAAPMRRSWRMYFERTPNFPQGVKIGGSELYATDENGKPHFEQFREDISTEEMYRLECHAYNRKYVSTEDRKAFRLLRDKRESEVARYGRPVETASSEEQILAAVSQVGDPKIRKLMLESALKALDAEIEAGK